MLTLSKLLAVAAAVFAIGAGSFVTANTAEAAPRGGKQFHVRHFYQHHHNQHWRHHIHIKREYVAIPRIKRQVRIAVETPATAVTLNMKCGENVRSA